MGVSIRATVPPYQQAALRGRPKGLTSAGGLLLIVLVSAIGGTVDVLTGTGLRRYFAVSLVVGAALAAMLVRRSSLWAVVITPPLLYVVASALTTFGSDDRVATFGDFASYLVTWLVYGFPEIASATGVTLLIAGIRLSRRTR